jgi:polysaccharide deacetylase family protein (PEP-CTERM system associated)
MQPRITPLRTPGRAPRVLTVDVEDWFHVCGDDYYSDPRRWGSFASRIEKTLPPLLDRLAHGNHRATFFFLGFIARRHPDLVREVRRRGHEIGVHGDLHRRAHEMTRGEFREDLLRAREAVGEAAGVVPRSHRAAEWSIRSAAEAALAVVAGEGFACDASVTPVPPLGARTNPPGPHAIGIEDRSIVEVPPLTGRGFGRPLFMGGGWPFRMFAPDRLAAAEERFRSCGWPAVFTFHPWEFDAAHPPMEGLSPLLRLVHFYGLASLPERFETWLDREADACVALEDVLPELAA